MPDEPKPDVQALMEAFSPALWRVSQLISKNNAKHNGRQGRLGGRTDLAEWTQSRSRHSLQVSMPDWAREGDVETHLAALVFNALGELTEMLAEKKRTGDADAPAACEGVTWRAADV